MLIYESLKWAGEGKYERKAKRLDDRCGDEFAVK
jgi:hypothetical protein